MAIVDLTRYDALSLAELIRSRAISAEELLEVTIERIEALDPLLNAVVHKHFDLARKAVADGLPDGPFKGVPFLVKNTGFEVKDMILSTGSELHRNTVSSRDGTLAARYKAGGLVIVGKSTTPEFALSFTTESDAFGAAKNPWDLRRTPGGSSGGSTSAVAAGLVSVANSSDGAGSTRVPASHCGLFGFKPSRMRNPLGPVAVEAIAGMSSPHVVSWSVRDSAALLDVSAGADIGDPYAAPALHGTFLSSLANAPVGLRIGMTLASPTGTPVDPQVLAAVRDAAKNLEALGHHVEDVPDGAGYDGHALMKAWRIIAGVSVATGIAFSQQPGGPDPIEKIEPVNQEWVREGRARTGIEYMWAINQLHATARALGRFFSQYDILLSPASADLPPLLGDLSGRGKSLNNFFERFWHHAPFTAVFNASGCPAMSVPLAQSTEGLPIGIHLGAAFGNDSLLFALAAQLEQAWPWFDRRPPAPFGRVS